MPIYKYRCSTLQVDAQTGELKDSVVQPCGHEYEILYTRFSLVDVEEPSEACPRCGGLDKTRLVSYDGISHELKGRGWYKDGY